MRNGFTLVEITVATALSAIMMAATCNFFIGSQRMLKLTLAHAELSLQGRAIRERMLFHAGPSVGNSSGLLSATDVTISGTSRKQLSAMLPRFADGSLSENEALALADGSRRLTDVALDAPGTSLSVSNRFFINLSGSVTVGGFVVRHDERVVVPLFGRIQPSDPEMGGGL